MTALLAQSPHNTSIFLAEHTLQNDIKFTANPRLPIANGLPPAYVCKKAIQVTTGSGITATVFCIKFFNEEEIKSKRPTKLKELIEEGRIVCVNIKDNKIETLFFTQVQIELMRTSGMTNIAIKNDDSLILLTEHYRLKQITEKQYIGYTSKISKDLA